MDIQKIQQNIFPEIPSSAYFKNLSETKSSFYNPEITGRNLLLEVMCSPIILPIFSPINYEELKYLIDNSDLKHTDSEGNNALLICIDKNIGNGYVELIMEKSDLSHKNNDGVNVLTLAILNQNNMNSDLLIDIMNSRDESFAKVKKGLSKDFYENRTITPDILENKYQSLKRHCDKIQKEKNERGSALKM